MTQNSSQYKKIDPPIAEAEEEEENDLITSRSGTQSESHSRHENPNPLQNINAPRQYPARNHNSIRRYGQNIL